MTTRVLIAVPPFNHKGVRVEVVDRLASGETVTETFDLTHMTVHELHLTDTRSLRLSEIDAEGHRTPDQFAAPPAPAEVDQAPAPAAEG